MNVELDDRIARATSRVGYVGRNFNRAAKPRAGSDFQVIERELRIAEAIAKRIKRCALNIPVARFEIGRGLRILREIVIVVERFLSAAARPAYRQVPRGIGVAGQHSSDSVAA